MMQEQNTPHASEEVLEPFGISEAEVTHDAEEGDRIVFGEDDVLENVPEEGRIPEEDHREMEGVESDEKTGVSEHIQEWAHEGSDIEIDTVAVTSEEEMPTE